MNYISAGSLGTALSDFRRARNQAILKEIFGKLTGQPVELLSYEEVRKQLRTIGSSERGLKDIPIDAIVGSVGRYTDFTRDFLPRKSTSEYRWAMVKLATSDLAGLPPIEVYQIGDVYFVKDGNHRVSVARQSGASHIQAYVTEVRTRVPLEPDTSPDEIILKAEYAEFLEASNLDRLRAEADLSVTEPGQYPTLLEHITVHRYYRGLEQKREIPFDEAVANWYDTIYLPVILPIREQGLLRYFPGRSEADLYLWISEHRAQLEEELGWEIKTEIAAADLLNEAATRPEPIFTRIGARILNTLTLGKLESGPPPGVWRENKPCLATHTCLFTDILVPVSGEPAGWFALDQALVIAAREQSSLHGLHIVDAEADIESEAAQAVQAEFVRRCAEKGLTGNLVVKTGEVARQIAWHARLNDLVTTTLLHPPPTQILARLDSGFRDLLARSPRPVLAVPQVLSPLNHALVAYDGSPKAQEALFVAASLVDLWKISLSVISVVDNGHAKEETLMEARMYLEERNIEANYLPVKGGQPAEAILENANQTGADMIVMGGYGLRPVAELVLGSVVDRVLRQAQQPVLICR
jgi:nucleotide-binding universal stress UspA family protein